MGVSAEYWHRMRQLGVTDGWLTEAPPTPGAKPFPGEAGLAPIAGMMIEAGALAGAAIAVLIAGTAAAFL